MSRTLSTIAGWFGRREQVIDLRTVIDGHTHPELAAEDAEAEPRRYAA